MEVAVDFLSTNLNWLIHRADANDLDYPMYIRILANYLLHYLGAVFFYFAFASASFFLLFRWNKDRFYPDTLPEDLSKQIRTEIGIAMESFPLMAVLITPFPVLLQLGYGKVYYSVDDYGWLYLFLSIPLFIITTDFSIYWIHRGLHHRLLYKRIHKLHHTYKYTTPFSSHAFNFVDGWAQGVSYYLFCFIFPLHHIVFLGMFFFVNMWTISIHDQVDFQGNGILNSTGHHTIHHVEFNYNYGQYFTLWDRVFGTYKAAVQTHEFSTFKRLPQSPKKKQS
eukprot:TRINITY_DN13391_c0_g1_i1.p1 TRINITY_DN13391_c0_g1~~TRINITY_DN13391_c0_g1_i1.p1  ORF type:complete len:298 (-),score=92.58 TRINITY_DN13391_c0_g1_i1:81-920(-)